ncbi:MAG: class I SAM-dependent methyltransferase [Oscillospiraceae bacterium]|nr:class I SAM-dependent methyltransferase [Oscillospiraceae bacterium]
MDDKSVVGNVVQSFYDSMASQYDKFYLDWDEAVKKEASFLSGIFTDMGFDRSASILDCACGIGTQAIGLASLGYDVTASDISEGEIAGAEKRAVARNVNIRFEKADFRALSDVFSGKFDIVIAMDNALPHMLTGSDLNSAVKSISERLNPGGLFVASIRDYDLLLKERPSYSAPYVHKTDKGQRVLFQTWDWVGDNYRFIQYIIDDEETTEISRFECEYRAVKREELSKLLSENGFGDVRWSFPEKSGFYQPVVTAVK